MRLVLIDIEELLHLDSWNVPSVPRAGELIELGSQNWRIEAIKWVKSSKARILPKQIQQLLGTSAVAATEVFAAAFLRREHSENEGKIIPLLTSDNVQGKDP